MRLGYVMLVEVSFSHVRLVFVLLGYGMLGDFR